jgi:hypothetical protein
MVTLVLDPALDMALRGAAAVLFATAAWHKLRDPMGFWQALAGYRLLPQAMTRTAAQLLPWAEISCAVSLILFPESPLPIFAALGLWLVYGAAIAINLLRGRRQVDCGCGGLGADQTLHWGLVIRNGLLAALTALLLLAPSGRPFLWIDALTGLSGALVLLLLYASTEHLMRNRTLLHGEALS